MQLDALAPRSSQIARVDVVENNLYGPTGTAEEVAPSASLVRLESAGISSVLSISFWLETSLISMAFTFPLYLRLGRNRAKVKQVYRIKKKAYKRNLRRDLNRAISFNVSDPLGARHFEFNVSHPRLSF